MFANGVINCNGKAASFEEGHQRRHRYARKLHILGCQVQLRDVKIITISHTLSVGLDIHNYVSQRQNTSLRIRTVSSP